MNMSELMETAAAWHGGMNSPLYSLVSTERIHGEEHREQLDAEISECASEEYMHNSIMEDEEQALRKLHQFVMTAPVDTDLSHAVADDHGNYLPEGWSEV